MKAVLVVMSLCMGSIALAGSPALQCKEIGAGPDNGYSVSISKSGNSISATVVQMSYAGETVVADLGCISTGNKPTYPDASVKVLACSESTLRDAGYSVAVNQGGFAGMTTATLSQESLGGAKVVAEMTCY